MAAMRALFSATTAAMSVHDSVVEPSADPPGVERVAALEALEARGGGSAVVAVA